MKVYKDAEQAIAQIPGLLGAVVQAAVGARCRLDYVLAGSKFGSETRRPCLVQ